MEQLIEFAGNHLILVGAFFFVLALLIGNLMQSAGAQVVIPTQAIQLLNREEAIPLDIRGAADYEAGHIIKARHIPLADLKSRLAELQKFKSRPIVVYCANGNTAVAATRILSSAGFEKIHSLKGGIASWRSENLPLTSGSAP